MQFQLSVLILIIISISSIFSGNYDQERIEKMNYRAYSLHEEEPYKSLAISDSVIKIIGSSIKVYELSTAYLNKSRAYYKIGEYINSLKANYDSYRINFNMNFLRGLALNYNMFGLLYSKKGLPDDAIEMFEKSLSISNEIEFDELTPNIFNNLGILYEQIGDYHRAISYLLKSVRIGTKNDINYNPGIDYMNIGCIFINIDQRDSASHYFDLALSYAEPNTYNYFHIKYNSILNSIQTKDSTNAKLELDLLIDISLNKKYYTLYFYYLDLKLKLLIAKNEYEKALVLYHEVNSRIDKIEDKLLISEFYQNYARLILKTQPEKSIELFDQSLEIDNYYSDLNGQIELHILKSEAFKLLKNYHQAFEEIEIANKIKDSISNLRSLREFEFVRIADKLKTDNLKKELEIENLQSKYQVLAFVIIFTLGCIALFFYLKVINRKLKLSRLEISEQKNNLESSSGLIRKVIKNNLDYYSYEIQSFMDRLEYLIEEGKHKDNIELLNQYIDNCKLHINALIHLNDQSASNKVVRESTPILKTIRKKLQEYSRIINVKSLLVHLETSTEFYWKLNPRSFEIVFDLLFTNLIYCINQNSLLNISIIDVEGGTIFKIHTKSLDENENPPALNQPEIIESLGYTIQICNQIIKSDDMELFNHGKEIVACSGFTIFFKKLKGEKNVDITTNKFEL